MSENGDCEIDFTLGIHIDKQYKAELNLINFIDKSKGDINVAIKKVEKIKEKEIELKQKQVQYFAQRIYATYIFKKLLKEFGNEIKAYPDIDIKEKGRDVTGGIMNESLWWIPTVQGKYKNQRFVSQGLWDDENYWNPHHIKLKKENDLRMEHVIDKASSKEYIIKRLVEKKLCNKGFHSDIINDLKSLLFGCIILKNEHSLLPAFGSIDDNLLAKKDVFRKYIGKKLTIKREDYDLEDGYYHLLKLETLNTCFKNTETDKIKDFKIYPDDLKKPMDKDNLAIFLKKKK